jgi:hypothetical protein
VEKLNNFQSLASSSAHAELDLRSSIVNGVRFLILTFYHKLLGNKSIAARWGQVSHLNILSKDVRINLGSAPQSHLLGSVPAN